jgi:hypothetical protein
MVLEAVFGGNDRPLLGDDGGTFCGPIGRGTGLFKERKPARIRDRVFAHHRLPEVAAGFAKGCRRFRCD